MRPSAVTGPGGCTWMPGPSATAAAAAASAASCLRFFFFSDVSPLAFFSFFTASLLSGCAAGGVAAAAAAAGAAAAAWRGWFAMHAARPSGCGEVLKALLQAAKSRGGLQARLEVLAHSRQGGSAVHATQNAEQHPCSPFQRPAAPQPAALGRWPPERPTPRPCGVLGPCCKVKLIYNVEDAKITPALSLHGGGSRLTLAVRTCGSHARQLYDASPST